MKPSLKYDEFMRQSGFFQDQAQQHGLYLLDRLYDNILEKNRIESKLHAKWMKYLRKNDESVQGLYLWGGVGRGKTFLMDIFYQVLPIKDKKRFHFHHFMQQVHASLTVAKKGKDPVKEIAQVFAADTRVLCIDEFVVTDIGDAMLIGRLLEALFKHGVVLVTTSNTPPDELYKDGLQRSNFLPAIELIARHCHISNLDGGQDYRLLGLKQTRLYQVPHNETSVSVISEYLTAHHVAIQRHDRLRINGRDINFEYCAEDTIWFQFNEICKTARSRFDYLEIARMYSTVVITGIETMHDSALDVARRFVSLIDVLYDHRVKLICTADVVAEELYQQQFMAFEFRRTVSRLLEMQSQEYIGQSHFCQ